MGVVYTSIVFSLCTIYYAGDYSGFVCTYIIASAIDVYIYI